MGVGGGASKAAQTLSEYYIKRAEQYHQVIPIGAGNEVTVVFRDGFQLKTIEELEAERTGNSRLRIRRRSRHRRLMHIISQAAV